MAVPVVGSTTLPQAFTDFELARLTRPGSKAAFHEHRGSVELAYGSACARADRALSEGRGFRVERRTGGLDAFRYAWPHAGASEGEVEDADDRYACDAHVETDATCLEFASHARCRFKSECRAAGETDGMNRLDGVFRA